MVLKIYKDTKEEILILFEEAKKGVNIDEDKIMETTSLKLLEISPDEQMNLFFKLKKKNLPRTKNQKIIFNYLTQKILFLHTDLQVQENFAVAKQLLHFNKD